MHIFICVRDAGRDNQPPCFGFVFAYAGERREGGGTVSTSKGVVEDVAIGISNVNLIGMKADGHKQTCNEGQETCQ